MTNTILQEQLFPLIRKAGAMMLQAHNVDNDVTEKAGTANFVTVHDVRIQEFLMNGIKERFPDACFIAEEKENDPSVLAGAHCFIIDPIDGTTNFIHDFRHSCVSVAMFSQGEAVFGAVYNPYMDELFYAEKGKGAYLNGQPIHVSDRPMELALAAYGTTPYYKEEFTEKTFTLCKKIFLSCADLRRVGAAALDLAYVAAGRVDLFFECRISPWDAAAGYLLIKEAGGVISDMEGNPYSFDAPCPVLAANPTVYPALLEIVKQTV